MFIGHLMMDISMVQTISLWELEMMILGNALPQNLMSRIIVKLKDVQSW